MISHSNFWFPFVLLSFFGPPWGITNMFKTAFFLMPTSSTKGALFHFIFTASFHILFHPFVALGCQISTPFMSTGGTLESSCVLYWPSCRWYSTLLFHLLIQDGMLFPTSMLVWKQEFVSLLLWTHYQDPSGTHKVVPFFGFNISLTKITSKVSTHPKRRRWYGQCNISCQVFFIFVI